MKWTVKATRTQILIFLFFACELLYPILSLLTNTGIANFLCDFLVAACFLYAAVHHLRNNKRFAWFLALACGGCFLLSSLMHPEYHTVLFEEYNIWQYVFGLRQGIMLMLILTLENDPQKLLDSLKIAAIPVWLAYTLRALLGIGLSEASGSNHAYGYAFLFVTIIYTIYFLQKKKFIYLGVAIVSLLQIILFASRTAILSYVVFCVMYSLFYDSGKQYRQKKTVRMLVFAFLVFVLSSDVFLSLLSDAVSAVGLSSRIIDSFLAGDIQLDGGRERTYLYAIELLKENPWGLGVYWDRYLCEFSYVHNFILEVLVDFGWLFGGLLLWSLLKNMVLILRSGDRQWKTLFILFFSLCMIRLFVSYSFWYDKNFWAMIAIIIGYRYSLKRERKNAGKPEVLEGTKQ